MGLERKENEMSDLVISVFGDELKAEESRLDLLRRQKQHAVDLDDAVVLVRTEQGRVKLHHVTHMTFRGAVGGGFLGTLLGVILLNPVFSLFGLAAGTVMGAVSGSMAHAGIDEDFINELAEHLKPGTSALCLLVRQHLHEALKELEPFGGRIIQRHLLHEDHERLMAVLKSVEDEMSR